jgi:hypothetical protein
MGQSNPTYSELVLQSDIFESLAPVQGVHLPMFLEFRRVSRQRADLYPTGDKPRRLNPRQRGYLEWIVSSGPGWILVFGALPEKSPTILLHDSY